MSATCKTVSAMLATVSAMLATVSATVGRSVVCATRKNRVCVRYVLCSVVPRGAQRRVSATCRTVPAMPAMPATYRKVPAMLATVPAMPAMVGRSVVCATRNNRE